MTSKYDKMTSGLRYVAELVLCIPKSDTIDIGTEVSGIFFGTFVVASKVFGQLLPLMRVEY